VNNKFKDFFNDPSKIMDNMIPPRNMMIDALLAVVGTNPLWYRDQGHRLLVCTLLGKIGDSMRQEQERTGKVDEDVWKAAFLTTCSELLLNTHQRYASEEEREMYPVNEDATEYEGDEDSDEDA
jgi:hypothetical protein